MAVVGGRSGARTVALPAPRGPWTQALYALLDNACDSPPVASELSASGDVLADDDLQMALYLCYELHYATLEGVDDRQEWSPLLLMFRGVLECEFDAALRRLVPERAREAASVGEELQRLVAEDDGPPLSRYVETQASLDQLLEHVVHRSAYQLKEADPHSWAIPRLTGPAKAALVEIQADEYGGGRPDRIHAVLFKNTMRALGLDGDYGAYLGWLPGITLATVNLMSYFGLHRRLRGALTGHLAVFEMTSSIPNRRYGNGIRRLGLGSDVTDFYDEHVEADAVHESIAAWDLANTLAIAEPDLEADILFGARALLALEARWAVHLLDSWNDGRTSLTRPLPQLSRL
ncbi:MAG: iron-containing redox enzyme family protein [Solirubrobacterales bacterium]|nr:iron-containing redox enzyme family protein [Solirubrobacterales bacterium]